MILFEKYWRLSYIIFSSSYACCKDHNSTIRHFFGLGNFSLGPEMITMEIGILMENTEKGIFLNYGVQLLEDWPEWGAQKGEL